MITSNFSTKKITIIILYLFSWLGLGTPIIWLSQADQVNAQFYNLFSKLFWFTFLIINLTIFILNYKSWRNHLTENWLIYILIFWLLFSALKTNLEFSAKFNIIYAVIICYLLYFNLTVSMCISNILKIITVSLSFYVLAGIATLIFHINENHVSLILIYTGFFCLGLYVLIRLKDLENIKILENINFNIFYVLLYLLSLLLLFIFLKKYLHYSSVLLVTNNFYNFQALYTNLNLFNRLLQVLILLSSVALILNYQSNFKNKNLYNIIFLFNFTISFILILFHKTQNGHLVSIVCTMNLIFIFIYFYTKKIFTRFFCIKNKIVYTILFSILIIIMIFSVSIYNFILYTLNSRIDFVYRINIWKEIFEGLEVKQLIFGIGLGSPYLTVNKNPVLDHLSHAHNGFIEIIVQCGILPYILVVVGLVKFAFGCIMSNVKSYSANMIAAKGTLILGLVTMNLFESVSLPYSTSTLLVFVLILISWTNFKDDFGK